jgi:pimeloyl-ACP methyl ester carboxylesterase
MLEEIITGDLNLKGDLFLPEMPKGLIIFAHGGGSSRKSPRNRYVAQYLWDKKLGTFIFDLLNLKEDMNYSNRFNINLLTERLIYATKFIKENQEIEHLNIGYFGASTGAAAALKAAFLFQNDIKAVVSRGGRVDLTNGILGEVKAATLFIVGGNDYSVLNLNKKEFEKLKCVKDLKIIEGAGHLFEEHGKLEIVADLARDWFVKNL